MSHRFISFWTSRGSGSLEEVVNISRVPDSYQTLLALLPYIFIVLTLFYYHHNDNVGDVMYFLITSQEKSMYECDC